MDSKQTSSLYSQLVDVLKEKIETVLKPHDVLPSERELSKIYGVSRTTVRLALQELENLGYIYKKHGKGNFVSSVSDSILNLSGTYSFTEQMKSLGKVPKTRILDMSVIKANKVFSENLDIPIGEKILKIKRLRLADGEPMMLERTYLPFAKFADLTQEMLEDRPLYDIFLDTYGEIIKYAEEEFYATLVREEDAAHLGVPAESASLGLIRKTYNMDNQIIEYTLSIARADQFRYKILHKRF
ncbi:GntR family transcriptional regulator [Vagococcus acidifermentans]|uniref:GntR family transcriptional regulator n=1 Tax=Vagococcus acidifermentans TaxID=564710 RepID=A0A430B361_9ENTE|nr:GntR family transcriptional regulator [Vagococcus acidifermentans]RSU14763.1 GntR family transcriptional regulator [Vagococcus acidifermentans]